MTKKMEVIVARHDHFIARAARMIQAHERGGPWPADAEFSENELKNLDYFMSDSWADLTGLTTSEGQYVPPVELAYKSGYHKVDDSMAWLKAFKRSLHHSKNQFESMLPSPAGSSQGHNITIHGSNYGPFQIDSPNATQSHNVQFSHVQNDLQQLRHLFAASGLRDLDKEEAAHALERIEELAARPKSPDLLARINTKVKELNNFAASTASLATTATPLLIGLWNKIQSVLPPS